MKKAILSFGVVLLLTSCGNGNNAEEATSDSTNINMGNKSPMGDTANQINNRGGNYPADTSNRNGDDSISGSDPASRSTTTGGKSNNSDVRPQ